MNSEEREHLLRVRDDSSARIGERLQAMRALAGLSQARLSERLGKHPSYVSKKELGTSGVGTEEALEWAEACGHQGTLLFFETGNNPGTRFPESRSVKEQLFEALNRNPTAHLALAKATKTLPAEVVNAVIEQLRTLTRSLTSAEGAREWINRAAQQQGWSPGEIVDGMVEPQAEEPRPKASRLRISKDAMDRLRKVGIHAERNKE